jgi:hypothetical protein
MTHKVPFVTIKYFKGKNILAEGTTEYFTPEFFSRELNCTIKHGSP